ncbi:5-formyltetrahydrofolate cyclo-ligase [Xylanimonas cellulosilytica DSM 15894]|uniref:5-formyltetrahydrofolate cyclo-ligase n=1 Tax=Xylanimonas cellulosilytica (strain DSM 15894 / JCM 12276 / CECT 5975 / KCTC 9989 / LMG 20990 / NBRC 107835 / XIL07) TaxID=446471 RepID=D1BYF5_XYLCX|nr:5-formyltetrahydrofolate cyclo-ligase [Xylanimonas cellulosilytica]ACZ31827.1 5-formyltetrahydrofolate cyclo-ligase [Xylanimonas cellulosilytica DSM 15894]
MTGDSTASFQPYPVRHLGDPAEAKEELRRAIRARRAARTPRQRADAATAFADVLQTVPEVRDAATVAFYAARSTEPGTHVLLERLAAHGARVLLPVLGSGLARDWAEYAAGEEMRERAPGRPPEPGGPALGAGAVAEADVVIVPALAVDTAGRRLGQGGGWYDRVLTLVPDGVTTIAMVFPDEVYDADERPLPTQAHDLPVQAVATTLGWRRLGPDTTAERVAERLDAAPTAR